MQVFFWFYFSFFRFYPVFTRCEAPLISSVVQKKHAKNVIKKKKKKEKRFKVLSAVRLRKFQRESANDVFNAVFVFCFVFTISWLFRSWRLHQTAAIACVVKRFEFFGFKLKVLPFVMLNISQTCNVVREFLFLILFVIVFYV